MLAPDWSTLLLYFLLIGQYFRELATQISEVLTEFLQDSSQSLSQQLFIGGNKVDKDIQNFEDNGGNVIIGTPGR